MLFVLFSKKQNRWKLKIASKTGFQNTANSPYIVVEVQQALLRLNATITLTNYHFELVDPSSILEGQKKLKIKKNRLLPK